VLGAESEGTRDAAARQLLDYGFRNYESRRLYAADTVATETEAVDGARQRLALGPGQDIRVTLPRGNFKMLEAEIVTRATHTAPVEAGQSLGKLILRYGDSTLQQYPLVALHSVDRGRWYHGLWYWLTGLVGPDPGGE